MRSIGRHPEESYTDADPSASEHPSGSTASSEVVVVLEAGMKELQLGSGPVRDGALFAYCGCEFGNMHSRESQWGIEA